MITTSKPKLIIDTDPGQDDALALMLVLLSQQFEVLAITTVAGNSTIENVTKNTQAILESLHLKVRIPIFSGDANPLNRKLITAVVHGESGLAGLDASKTQVELTRNAYQKIVELVNTFPGEISILALGPLTNLAKAIQLDSSFQTNIKQLVIMGGAIEVPGNMNRVAEFNFFVDPEAAEFVMNTTTLKTMIPLDLCNQVVLQLSDFQQIQNNSRKNLLSPMMELYIQGLMENEGTSGILVYDALAAYFLMRPKAFSVSQMNIQIETKGDLTRGMSVAEKRSYKNTDPNVQVATGLNIVQFKRDFFEILSR